MKIGDKWKGFIVGNTYEKSNGVKAIFCGINDDGTPVFELKDKNIGVSRSYLVPKEWSSMASNDYWHHHGLERSFSNISEQESEVSV